MGNEIGLPPSQLGITSLGVTTPNIELKEMEKLLQAMRKSEKDQVDKNDFQAALKQVDKFQPPDVELFNQLFILFDEQGHEVVDFRSIVAGCAVCLATAPMAERLRFALSVYDSEGGGRCLRGDLKRMLLSVNSTAAFFGDPVLTPAEVDNISLEAFKAVPAVVGKGIAHEDCVAYLLKDETVKRFLQGEGQVRFGSPDLVTS
eukprot:gene8821-9724_t